MKKLELRQIIREEISKVLNESITSFKSINDMNKYLTDGDYDGLDGYGKKELSIINKHIKSDILDKGKELTPRSLNSLIVRLENKYDWY
jgi:CO dehydrogenase/acetyl-CoA synthase epsilon subunit